MYCFKLSKSASCGWLLVLFIMFSLELIAPIYGATQGDKVSVLFFARPEYSDLTFYLDGSEYQLSGGKNEILLDKYKKIDI